MKTQMMKFSKTMALVFVSALMITLGACGDSENKLKKHAADAPSMDLMSATLLGDLKTIQQHIDHGSDLDFQDTLMGSTALMTAAVFNRKQIAEVLIEAGADVNITNKEGSTALISAAFLGRTEIVRMLLDNGADKSITNIYGSTAYQSVEAPFEAVKFIYDQFSKDLGPLGLKLDYEAVAKARPMIAAMLK